MNNVRYLLAIFLLLVTAIILSCGGGGVTSENSQESAPEIVIPDEAQVIALTPLGGSNQPSNSSNSNDSGTGNGQEFFTLIPGFDNNAQNIEPNKKIELTFSKEMNATSINSGTFFIEDSAGNKVSGTVFYDVDSKTASFLPDLPFDYEETYRLIIKNGISDTEGNHLANDVDYNFSIKKDNDPPFSANLSPVSSGSDIPVNAPVSITFNEKIDISSVSAASFKSVYEGGTVISGTYEISADGKTVTFSHENFNYSSKIFLEIEGIKDLKGNSCSKINWSFTTIAENDTSAPTVLLTVPQNNQTGSINEPLHNGKIYIKMNEAINPSTVDSSTVVVKKNTSSVGGSISMTSSDTIEFTPTSALDRETSYTVSVKGGLNGVRDLAGNNLETDYSFSFTTLETLKVVRHYYDKGYFNKDYISYDTAFADNYSDTNIQIHSYIVVEFNFPVDAASISEKLLVKRNAKGTAEIADSSENNYNVIGKVHGGFPNNPNLRGQFIGELSADPADNKKVVFKHHKMFYAAEHGSYDIEHPNWNGIKPGYQYDVTINNGVRDIWGGDLAAHNASSNVRNWSFTTTDLDYGLYWFKDGYNALKYVPGRAMPVEYYNPVKPIFLHSHGWQNGTTGLSRQGSFRDYRREDFLWGGTTNDAGWSWDVNTPTIDITDPWKNGADIVKFPNGYGKNWNVGAVYWTQFADNQDEGGAQGSAKPRRAGTAIWSMYGPSSQENGRAEYATNKLKFADNKYKYEFERITANSPNRAMSTIMVDIFQSCCTARPAGFDSEFRLTGHSLGNQMVNAMLYILKTRHAAGTLPDYLMPDRFFLVDPYWVDDDFWLDDRGDDWENTNAPEATGYWWRAESPVKDMVVNGRISGNALPGQVCTEIIKDVIAYYISKNNSGCPIKNLTVLPTVLYDTSGLPDGKTSNYVTFYNGDWNEPYREQVAVIYHYYEWLSKPNDLTKLYGWGEQHGNGRYHTFYQFGFNPPAGGISPSSSSAVIISAMNCFKADANKGRYEYIDGMSSSSIHDDTYTWKTNIQDGGRTGAWKKNIPKK